MKTSEQKGIVSAHGESSPLLPRVSEFSEHWSRRKSMGRLLKLGIPFSIVRLVDIVSELVAGKVMADFGVDSLAANAIIIALHRTIVSSWIANMYAMGPQYAEVSHDSEVGDITRQGMLAATILGIPTAGALCFSSPILKLIKQSPAVSDIVQDFYRSGAFSIPGILYSAVIQQFTLGIGKPNAALVINLVNNLLISTAGPILAYGCFGLPRRGVIGLGYAYSGSFIITSLASFLYFCAQNDYRKYSLARLDFSKTKYLKELFRVGFPCGAQVLSDFMQTALMTFAAGWLGTGSLSAVRVADMLYIVPFVVLTRMPQATCNLTKSALAGHNESLVRQLVSDELIFDGLFTLAWSAGVNLFSQGIVNFLVKDTDPDYHEIISMTRVLGLLYPIGLGDEIVRYGMGGSLRGFKDTKTAMWNSIFCLDVVGLPLIYLAFSLGGNLPVLYVARNCSLLLAAGVIAKKWFSKVSNYFRPQETNINSHVLRAGDGSSSRSWFSGFFSRRSSGHTERAPLLADVETANQPLSSNR